VTSVSTDRHVGARAHLVDAPMNYLDGQWEPGEGTGECVSINPATGEVLARGQAASVDQAKRAIAIARRAFDEGPWARTTPRERSDLLRQLAEAVDRTREELVELVVSEVGAPVRLARAMQVGMPIANLAWSADVALRGPYNGYEQALPPHLGVPPSSSLLRYEPIGVVAAIAGYNFPINSLVWKLGPALAAGCTIVLKPSPRAPLAAVALIRIVEEIGLPPGVVNLLLGDGDVGSTLSSHPDVDMVMFTGSSPVGRRVMADAATMTKKVVMELGGKSPSIVLAGADVEEVVASTTLRFCRMSGQACGATTRTLVPRSMYDDFAAASEAFLPTVAVGDPRREETEIGPLIRDEHRQFVEASVEAALARGATILAGGGRPEGLDGGYFVNPALIGGVDNADPICREELFGPIGTLLPYDSVNEAIRIANDSEYALHAAVFGPFEKAFRVAGRLRSGSVAVNGGGFMRPDAPWGGSKASGFGREMGDDGFREFFNVKHIQWPIR
jgi:aldehyde dehydrogenase (NAD+)